MIKTTVGIEGMICGMCESHINDVVRKNFKVKKVNSSHAKALCEIISENEIDESKLKKAISDTGYSVTSFKAEPYEKRIIFIPFKIKLMKKAVQSNSD